MRNNLQQNKLNTQAALDYTLYMMTASRFRKALCRSHILEEQLYLRYRNQRPSEQESMEEICIEFADHYLPSVLPADIWDCRVNVRFRKNREEGTTSIVFDGGCFVLSINARINSALRVLVKYTFREEEGLTLSGMVTLQHKFPKDKHGGVILVY